jgi:RNA polymerase sigma-70 factor (family 1)
MIAKSKLYDLQQRIAVGDQLAYQKLFTMYYSKLRNFSNNLVGNKEYAEEIVNDVFINLWRRRIMITEIENLQLYLYHAAKNASLNHLNKSSRTKTVSIDEVVVEMDTFFNNPEEILITKQMSERLHTAVNDLPNRCRMILKLVKEDGLSYKETAQLLNISVSTVDNQLVLALKKLSAGLYYSFSRKK